MIGVFDSGAGGLTALAELRKIQPSIDVCFLADRKNAPYGTKSRREIIRLVTRDVVRLREAGADKILMACCTASTVYPFLDKRLRECLYPIIMPTAKEAARTTENGRIGVIATNATVKSGAFSEALSSIGGLHVTEIPAQELVSVVEGEMKDGRITQAVQEKIARLLMPLRKEKIDTLILGYTHFPHLEKQIAGCLPGVRLISPSREGAKEIIKSCLTAKGKGITVYL